MSVTAPAGIVAPPDAVAVVCGHLRALVPDQVIVGTRLPDGSGESGAYDGSQTVIKVHRIGGALNARTRAWLDNPNLDIEVWGPLEQDAADLINEVRAYMLAAPYTDLSALGAVVSDAVEDVGPQWFSDPDYPPAGHQLIQWTLTLHPVPPTP